MVLNFALAGRSRMDVAFNTVRQQPSYALGLILGAILAVGVSPLWGCLHPWSGWHRMRSRLSDEGFIALGEILAPQGALDDYRDGIWRGIWRTHGASLGFFILQVPIIALMLVPWEIAHLLFQPVAKAYVAHPSMHDLVSMGIPNFFLVAAVTIVFAQHLLAWRMLGNIQGPHKLGTLFAVTGASWRKSLNDGQALVSLAILAGAGAGIGFIFSEVNAWLADAAHLSSPDTISMWIILAVGVAFSGLFLEAIGEWTTSDNGSVAAPAQPYSFTSWLVAWLKQVFAWLFSSGLTLIGVGAVFFVGVNAAFQSFGPEAIFSDGSWGGLGWFIAAAVILMQLRKSGGDS